jgi:hypothetical protein
MVNKAIKYVTETGGLFPSLYLFKKGSPVETNLTEEETKSLVENPGVEICHSGVYMTVELFDNNSHQAPTAQDLVKRIVARSNPDAVGIMLIAHYKEFTTKEYKKLAGNFNLAMDPEAIKVINACYYLREDKEPTMRVVPFLDRSGMEPDFSSNDEGSIIPVSKPKRDIHFVNTPWIDKKDTVEPWLKNPY